MTTQEKNILIAKAYGWVRRQWTDRKGRQCIGWRTPDGKELGGSPPNYCDDLNAMHEAEKLLIGDEFDRWCLELAEIVSQAHGKSEDGLDMFDILHPQQIVGVVARATAQQRADAFIATLNLH